MTGRRTYEIYNKHVWPTVNRGGELMHIQYILGVLYDLGVLVVYCIILSLKYILQ